MKNYLKETDAAVTVCNANGIILYMNEKSVRTFAKSGGKNLIGKSLIDCHTEPARSKLLAFLKTHETNSYTIEKNGIKKIILQRPWLENSVFMGYIEFSFEIPMEMEHHKRG